MSKEVIVILIIVLLLFGATALPKLARSLGEASREFKKGIGDRETEEAATTPQSPPTAPAAAPNDPNEKITMSRAELDALLAERERNASRDVPPPAQG
ncbi:MAG: twin-arginine translocase TatA/TatE family subunit [Acidimicrobiia bacterium]|nr:twin-arginine translocase TatA/TatE family subunit [Acidimicrobiia bacterium]